MNHARNSVLGCGKKTNLINFLSEFDTSTINFRSLSIALSTLTSLSDHMVPQ